jgi:hypothetical protein
MTAQSNHTLDYDGQRFQLTSVSREPLFDPTDYALSPTVTSTGCWDGYLCHFAAGGDRLSLQTLWLNHGQPLGRWCESTLPMPLLNGVAADEKYDDSGYQEFQGRYDNVNLRLAYTGDILISSNGPDERYLHGYPWPWHFACTMKLSFIEGRLTARKDISTILRTFDSRYCVEGYLYGDQRRNGLRFLRRHVGHGFRF